MKISEDKKKKKKNYYDGYRPKLVVNLELNCIMSSHPSQ